MRDGLFYILIPILILALPLLLRLDDKLEFGGLIPCPDLDHVLADFLDRLSELDK